METLRSFTLNLTVEQMLVQQGRPTSTVPLKPSTALFYQQALRKATGLAEPVALYDVFEVRGVEGDRLILANGHAFRSHLVVSRFSPARRLAVAICTIGPRVEAEASASFADGNGAYGFLIDSAGSLAVSQTAQALVAHLQDVAAQVGMKASFPISPGSADCTLEDQRTVFDLLPAQDIGVRLSDSYLMLPLKSVSMLIALGQDLPSADEMAQCDFCSRQDTCPHARLRALHHFEKPRREKVT
jgi:hypothetical protein